MNIKSIKTSIDGPIPLILKYCRKLKIAEYINRNVQYDEKDVEKYFGAGITAENLNDDALERSLDDLYSIGAKETFSSIAIESIKTFDIALDSVHADTTSKNVYGKYENPSHKNGCIKLERSHSKDHRPDLRLID